MRGKMAAGLALLLLLLAGCSTTKTTKIELNNDKENIIEISYDEVKEMIDGGENFIVYIGRTDCIDCQNFAPIIKQYLEDNEGTYVYYFDIKEVRDASLAEDATTDDVAAYESLRSELDFDWTPTLHHYVDGEIESSYQYLDENYYELSIDEKDEAQEEFVEVFYSWINSIFGI